MSLCDKSPGVFVEQGADEMFGLVCNLLKALVKLPLGSRDQGEGLRVVVALERRLAAQPEDARTRRWLR